MIKNRRIGIFRHDLISRGNWGFCRVFSGWQLSQLTHEKGTSWHKKTLSVAGKQGSFGGMIQEEDIEKHYEERIRKNLQRFA